MTKNSVGLKILNYYIDNDKKLELTDTTNYRTEESGFLAYGFIGFDSRGDGGNDQILYNRDIVGFRHKMSTSSSFMDKAVVNSYSLDVLLVAEFGHTSASSIFGLSSKKAYDEVISHGTVENSYRAAVNKPLRKSYFKKDDIYDYMRREKTNENSK